MLKKILCSIVVGIALTVLAGCRTPTPKPVAKPETPLRVLEVGETKVFAFPSDGEWQHTPYLVLNAQTITIRPLGIAVGLAEEALRFQVGEVPQLVRPGQPVRITMPGPLLLKVDRRYASGFHGQLEVEIKRTE